MKGSIFLAREGRGDEGFEFLRVDSGFREKGSSICEKAMKGSSFFAGSELSPAQKIKKKTGQKKRRFYVYFYVKKLIFSSPAPRSTFAGFSNFKGSIDF